MKKILFAALAATVLFASCAKEGGNGKTDDGSKAYLNVSVKAPVSRAAGAAKPTDDVINNFTAFVAYADGTLISGYSSDGSDLTDATSNAIVVSKNLADGQHVYVVANAGDLRSSITTKALLDSYIADLNLANGGQQEAENVWATGKTATGLAFTQIGDEFIAKAEVELTFIASRITITIDNQMSGYNATNTDDELVLNKVAVLNARGASYLFGTSLIPADAALISPAFNGTKFYSGIDGSVFANYPASTDVTAPVSYLADDIPANDFNKVYYYYVFENDAVVATNIPTIVTLVASFDGGTIYFPVHLTPYEQFLSGSGSVSSNGLERGKSYDITIRLTVDPTNPGGTTDPTDPLITAKVEVELEINDWIPVTLIKEF